MVKRILPLFDEFIDENTIDRAYRIAERRRGEVIQRRSSAKLTPSILVCIEIYKALNKNISYRQALQEVWNHLQDERIVEGTRPSPGSLCEARQRLPIEVYQEIYRRIDRCIQEKIDHQVTWNGYTIKTIDGVPLTLPHRPGFLEKFLINNNQHGTAYWPKATNLWVFDAGTGGLVGHLMGAGGEGESSLAPELIREHIREDDLLIGDADFGTTAVISTIKQQEAAFLCRTHNSIEVDKHTVRKSGDKDRDLEIPVTEYMKDRYEHLQLPEQINVRAIKHEADWYVTDLSRDTYSRQRLTDQLVGIRWGHEVRNREIKTYQNLELVRSKREGTMRKEVLANLIVYNVVRLMFCRVLERDREDEQGQNGSEQGKQERNRVITDSERTEGVGVFCVDNDQVWVRIREYSYLEGLREVRYANRKIAEHPEKSRVYIRKMKERLLKAKIYRRKERTEPRMKRPDPTSYPEFVSSRKQWKERNLQKET